MLLPRRKIELLKTEIFVLASRNANIVVDIGWFAARNKVDAVLILEGYKKANDKKIERLQKRLDRLNKKYENKGQHVLDPKYKEKN